MSVDDSKLQNQFDEIIYDHHYITELKGETHTPLPRYVLDIFNKKMLISTPRAGLHYKVNLIWIENIHLLLKKRKDVQIINFKTHKL